MSGKHTKFDLWWNTPEVKQKLGAVYSLGASIVIIGAMFKILHLPGASLMLGAGMSIEAFLFALGIFDQPHKDYEWDKIYDFENGSQKDVEVAQVSTGKVQSGRSVGLNYTETINDDDVKKLSEGIKNLSDTAHQFAGLSTVLGATDKLVKSIDGAADATDSFVKSQQTLNVATGKLSTSYQGISDGMEAVEKNTKQYAGKVEEINKNLSSINSIYEIQLKNIQAQSEGIAQQTERVKTVTTDLGEIVVDVQKMKVATNVASTETESFKAGTTKLAKQIADLNQVYGNMLNALS